MAYHDDHSKKQRDAYNNGLRYGHGGSSAATQLGVQDHNKFIAPRTPGGGWIDFPKREKAPIFDTGRRPTEKSHKLENFGLKPIEPMSVDKGPEKAVRVEMPEVRTVRSARQRRADRKALLGKIRKALLLSVYWAVSYWAATVLIVLARTKGVDLNVLAFSVFPVLAVSYIVLRAVYECCVSAWKWICENLSLFVLAAVGFVIGMFALLWMFAQL